MKARALTQGKTAPVARRWAYAFITLLSCARQAVTRFRQARTARFWRSAAQQRQVGAGLALALLMLALLLLLALAPPALAAETAAPGTAADAAQYTDLDGLEDYLGQLDREYAEYLDGFSLSALWQSWLKGDLTLDFKLVLQVLMRIFFKEVAASASLLAQLVGVALLSVLLTTLHESFDKSDTSMVGRAVIFLLLAGIAINSFSLAMNGAREAVSMMTDFVYAALPVLLPLLAAMGGVSTVGIVQPALLLAISLLMDLMRNFIFPLVYFSAILRLVGQISPKLNIDKLAGLLKDLAMGVMSVSVTVFIAFLGLSGLASSSIDGLAVKAVKTASGIFIPVVGRSFAEAFDSILGTALLLKNVIGVIGAIAILFICALPAVKIIAQVLIYRLAAALLQPLGEDQLSAALSGLSNSLLLLFAVLAICGLFSFFAIAIVVGAGNMTMMMR